MKREPCTPLRKACSPQSWGPPHTQAQALLGDKTKRAPASGDTVSFLMTSMLGAFRAKGQDIEDGPQALGPWLPCAASPSAERSIRGVALVLPRPMGRGLRYLSTHLGLRSSCVQTLQFLWPPRPPSSVATPHVDLRLSEQV